MAKKTTTLQPASLLPQDGTDASGFQGGPTYWSRFRLRYGWPKADGTIASPDQIVCQIDHTPKSTGEAERLLFSASKSTSDNFVVGNAKGTPLADKTKLGRTLLPKSSGAALNRRSAVLVIMSSLQEKGFPADKMRPGDFAAFDDLTVEMEHRASPGRGGGLQTGGKDDGEQFKQWVVTKILKTPWDAEESGGDDDEEDEGEEKTTVGEVDDDDDDEGEGEAAEDSDDDDDEDQDQDDRPAAPSMTAEAALVAILESAGGTIERGRLFQKAFQVLKAVPDRNRLCGEIVDTTFLGKKDQPWTYDRKTKIVSLRSAGS